jgi:hypothetical protein
MCGFDLIVINAPAAMRATTTHVEVLSHGGEVLASLSGRKHGVARELVRVFTERLIER